VLGAVSIRRDRREFGGVVHRESWIARRHAFDDVACRMTLVHQCARPRADGNGVSLAVIGDAGVVERGQKARITVGIIAAWIGLCGRGHADYGGETCKQNKLSHRLILVQMGVVVLPTRFVGPLIPEFSYEIAVVLCAIEG
jgi:hypothetical protein